MTQQVTAADDLATDGQQQAATAKKAINLDDVRALAEKQKLLELEAENLQEQLDAKLKELKDVAEYQLPKLLEDAKLSSLTMTDGSVVTVEDINTANINDTNRSEAHAWLRKEGLGDLIKNELTVVFGKGEDEYAQLLKHNIQVMADNDVLKFGSVEQKEAINWQTLRSVVKERLEAGKPVPLELLKVYQGKRCKIKKPKVR